MVTEKRRKQMAPYQTGRWNRLRIAVRKRDEMTCQKCGQVGGKMEVDHIVPVHRGGDFWSIDGLQLLCRRCHYTKSVAERPSQRKYATLPSHDSEVAAWRRFTLELL